MDKLLQLRAAALAKAEALRAKAFGESRAMTDEERTEFRGLMDECDRINGDIEQEKRFAAAQLTQESTRAAAQPTRADQLTERPNGNQNASGGGNPHDRAEDRPFRSLGEKLLSIRSFAEDPDNLDPRLRPLDLRQAQVRAASGLNESVASDGGFLVGKDAAPGLIDSIDTKSEVWTRAEDYTVSTSSNGMTFNGIDEVSRANGSRSGGVQVYLASEADAYTSTKPKFAQIEMSLKKLLGLCYMTDEQLQDASITEQIVTKAFAREFAFKLDDLAIRGTGAGAPLGILNAACTVSVAKETLGTSQAAASIVYANVSKMRARMNDANFKQAVWFVNIDCQPALEQMFIPHTNKAGTENVGGTAAYLPPGGASGNPYGQLLGRPVVPIEHCETVGTVGDIILADMKAYYTLGKGGLETASSLHVRFLNGEMAFRFTMRIDGQPSLKAPLTPYKGTGTLSPFVTLAVRA